MDIQIDYQDRLIYSLGSTNKVYMKKGKTNELITTAYTKSKNQKTNL